MFAIAFGSENREKEIKLLAESDHTTAIVLAAVHFEWMLKRTILKLGIQKTKDLREKLEQIYSIGDRNGQHGYMSIWNREVAKRFKNASLGTVLGNLVKVQNTAMRARGKVVHGNGTISKELGLEVVDIYIIAGKKLREFACKHGEDVDKTLIRRLKPRQPN